MQDKLQNSSLWKICFAFLLFWVPDLRDPIYKTAEYSESQLSQRLQNYYMQNAKYSKNIRSSPS